MSDSKPETKETKELTAEEKKTAIKKQIGLGNIFLHLHDFLIYFWTEFYFSDANLPNDKFLFTEASKTTEGCLYFFFVKCKFFFRFDFFFIRD